MDKFTKNPHDNSNIDSMIEKFRTDINKETKEEHGNTRKLTVESPFRIDEDDSSVGVDQRLTDLECLITRLQNEIDDMANDNGPIVNDKTKRSPESSPDKNNKEGKKDNQIYHLAVKDFQKPNGQYSNLRVKKSESHAIEVPLCDSFMRIRKNFSLLWDDGKEFEDNVLTKKEGK